MKEQLIEKDPKLIEAEQRVLKAQENLKAKQKQQNADRRKAENHQKYTMGGLVVKYLVDAFLYEDDELDQIISAGIRSRDCQSVVSRIRNAGKSDLATVVSKDDDEDEIDVE